MTNIEETLCLTDGECAEIGGERCAKPAELVPTNYPDTHWCPMCCQPEAPNESQSR